VSVVLKSGKKKIYEGFGEMLYTHFGLSGPLILTVSALFARNLAEGEGLKLLIDLKPSLTTEVLEERLLKEFSAASNKEIKNVMRSLIPSSMIMPFLRLCSISGEKKVNSVTAGERKKIVSVLKGFCLNVSEAGGFNEAVVTKGGIKVNEIDPKTMESKLVKNVFFAGEIIDVDAFTGGFNLQIAWSTGYAAGSAVSGISG
jgi:predicted Rossmann fold flavoprotein